MNGKEYLAHLRRELHEVPERERLMILVELARELEPYPEGLRKRENRVPGCMSDVYVHAELDPEGRVRYIGAADSLVVGGYVKILVRALNGLRPHVINEEAEHFVSEFLEHTKLRASLISSRANAFGNIFDFMKEKAVDLEGKKK